MKSDEGLFWKSNATTKSTKLNCIGNLVCTFTNSEEFQSSEGLDLLDYKQNNSDFLICHLLFTSARTYSRKMGTFLHFPNGDEADGLGNNNDKGHEGEKVY